MLSSHTTGFGRPVPHVGALCASRRVAIVGGLALAVVLVAPAAAAQVSSLDLIRDDYRTAAEAARPVLLSIARGLFGVLAVIEIALAGIWWALRERGPAEVLSALVVKLGWLGFVFALLASFEFWFVPIVDGFVAAGQRTAVGPPMSPGDVFAAGAQISSNIREGYFDSVSGLELLNPRNWDSLATVFVTATAIEFIYLAIAAMIVLAFVEAFVVLTTGSLVLGFAAFRGTASLADRFVAYAFAVGIRLFLLFLLVGVGQNLAVQWEAVVLADPTNQAVLLEVLGGSFTFALIVIVIPFKVSSYLTSDFSPGFVRALLSVG